MAISLLQFAAQADSIKKSGLIEKITAEAEMFKRLKFIQVDGFEYAYNRRDTLGGIAFRGLNENYTPDIGVVNPQIEYLGIMGGSVQTDYQIQNKQGDRVRAAAIGGKTKKIGLQYDRYFLQGDPAVTPKSFYGLNNRLVGAQVIVAGANGAALTLAMLDQAVDQTVGGSSKDKYILCNKYIRRQITALVRPGAIGGVVGKDEAAMQLQSYNDVPIIVLDEDAYETPILAEAETQGSSNVTTSLYVIRLGGEDDEEYIQGLIGSELVNHFQTAYVGTYFQDVIESNCGLAMFHPRAATRIQGLL